MNSRRRLLGDLGCVCSLIAMAGLTGCTREPAETVLPQAPPEEHQMPPPSGLQESPARPQSVRPAQPE